MAHYFKYVNPWIPEEALAILRREQGSILDVGGSSPHYKATHILDIQKPPAEQIRQNCWGYDDASKEEAMARDWESIPYTTLDLCDGQRWPFDDKSFDLGLCSHTLEDIRDPLPACRELARVCKRVLIICPSRLIEHVKRLFHPRLTGFLHHAWVVYEDKGVLVFRRKSQVFELSECHISCPLGKTVRNELGSMFVHTDKLDVRIVDWLPDDAGECEAFIKPYRNRRDIFVWEKGARSWRYWVWALRQRF